MAAFKKFDLSLIPSAQTGRPVAQVAQTAQVGPTFATFATCAGDEVAPERGPAPRRTDYTPIPEPGPGADARLWIDWYQERCAIREYEGGYPRPMAETLTYDEAVNRWHRLHVKRPNPAHCAGCSELLSGAESLPLPDGGRVHIDDELACLRRYGKRWRNEAMKALAEIGITP